MKVHKSNYDIVGFTEEASLEELVEIGKKHDLPVIFDMGNGLMLDMSEYGIDEPNIPASLATGIDVMLFSGDKLLSPTYKFSLIYMGYINLFANTTQYLSRPGELMRTCFVILVCYGFHYLWRERKWLPLAVMSLCSFYYVYYEIYKFYLNGGSIFVPELYHTFL